MAATPVMDPPDQLALVSSLYGPGTIACWYLTILSVLISWTLHPRKRKSGSIDVDFIALLTLATVSAGHLLSEVPKLLTRLGDDQDSIDAGLLDLQLLAAFAAPLAVIETFALLSFVLFIIAATASCNRRAIAVVFVGLMCFAVDCYLHFWKFSELDFGHENSSPKNGQHSFRRVFFAEFRISFTVAIVAIPVWCLLVTIAFALYMLLSSLYSRTPTNCDRWIEEACTHEQPRTERNAMDDDGFRESLWLKMIYAVIFPASFVTVLVPLQHFTRKVIVQSSWETLLDDTVRKDRELFPKTNCTITDLDQAMPMAAGVAILAFNIYSAAKHRYKARRSDKTPLAPTGNALNRLYSTTEP